MAKRESSFRSPLLFCSVIAMGLTFFFGSVVSLCAEGLTSAGEAGALSFASRDRGTGELPGGMDPVDVVRMVGKNRAQVAQEASMRRIAEETPGRESPHATAELGSAFQIGGPGRAPGQQSWPAVAFDGTNYLVVWTDSRNTGSDDIYGARVSPAGSVLDPFGIAISTAASWQNGADLAFDGTNYLVVWHDYRGGQYPDIYGARVDTGGVVLDPSGIAISTANEGQRYPAIAFDGTNYLVVWCDNRSGIDADIYGTRVGTDGSVFDPSGIPISTASGDQLCPDIAFDGNYYYLAVWHDYRSGSSLDVYGVRLDKGGMLIDPSDIPISQAPNNQAYAAIAFDGSNYLVVWEDERSGSSDIYGTRVTVGAGVLNPNGIPISTADDAQEIPAVVFCGTNYLIAWYDNRNVTNYDIYGARMSTGGSVLDPEGRAICTAAENQQILAIASDGINSLVVWGDDRLGADTDLYGGRVTEGGSVLDPAGIAISTAGVGNENNPAVSFDGMNYLVVWQDYRSGSECDIYGARVNVAGVVLDPTGIAISTAANIQVYPDIAFDGTNYVVVWQDYRNGSYSDIYGARVSPEGVVLDLAGIAISTAADHQCVPAVAFDGTNYLIVWHDYRSGATFDIYGARLSAGGSVLDPAGIAVSTADSHQEFPDVAFDGTNYLVVWRDNRVDIAADIYGARVSAAGSVIDATGIGIYTDTSAQDIPSIAFDGTNYLVVWNDFRNGDYSDIYGTRVSTAGSVLDGPTGIAVCTAPDNQDRPAVTFDGMCYLIVWEDWRNEINCDIFGGRVNPGGMPLDFDGFPVSNAIFNQAQPCAGAGPFGQTLVGYGSYMTGEYNCSVIWGNMHGGYVGVEDAPEAPAASRIYQSYPNPFNPVCTIQYEIGAAGRVSLRVFDVSGSVVRTLVVGWREPGVYSEVWDGRADVGNQLPSGVYFCRLEAGDFVAARKMVLLK